MNLKAGVEAAQSRQLNDMEQDGLLTRFQLALELSWNVMKAYAEFNSEDNIMGSRDAVRVAFRMSLISDADLWFAMITWRNNVAHRYDGELAEDTIRHVVAEFYPAIRDFCLKMGEYTTDAQNNLFSQK